tara:strand:+ start:10377 stop:11174 length:798 start_codon:yes stop_codon:yes gene_type:complete
MKITLFTADKPRHIYLINKLSQVADQLFVIQEKKIDNIFDFNTSKLSKLKVDYYDKVNKAQNLIFKDCEINNNGIIKRNLKIKMGQLSSLSILDLDDYLQSDLYIIFGSSFIKGDLVEKLVDKSAINLHMGISPFYRGSACNFWALYDNRPDLVGATIHYLTKGIDSGPILYHAVSEQVENDFIYSMSTVKSAILSLALNIKNNTIFRYSSEIQNNKKEIRYSKKSDFNDVVINKYNEFDKRVKIPFDSNKLKDYFFLKKENFFS